MEKLFVYGTLKRGFGNHHYLKTERYIGRAVTKEKYALYEAGIPCVVKNRPVCRIKGEVYEVTKETLRNIDLLEGHPFCYRREKIPVILENGTRIEAWIYFYPHPQGKLNPTGIYGNREAE